LHSGPKEKKAIAKIASGFLREFFLGNITPLVSFYVLEINILELL
jgi:hypothetical protein